MSAVAKSGRSPDCLLPVEARKPRAQTGRSETGCKQTPRHIEAPNQGGLFMPRRCLVKKLRNARNHLRWRERLIQQHAIGDAVRRPLIRCGSGHVDDRHLWVQFSGALGDLPACKLSLQIDIREESAVFGLVRLKQRNRLLT